MEFTGPKKRYFVGTVLDFFFALGEISVAGIGYLLRDRNMTLTVLFIPLVLLFPSIWVIPESPRWLLLKGRKQEVLHIVTTLGKVNGKPLERTSLEQLTVQREEVESILPMFRSLSVIWRFAIVFLNWFVVSLMFYGLLLNSMETDGNPYMNLFLFSLMEFPAYVVDLILLKFIGRRIVMCVSMCIGGIACICTIFPLVLGDMSQIPILLVLKLIGKFGAAMAFTTLYTFTSELLPTSTRCRGLAFCNIFARLAGVVAPYIYNFDQLVDGPVGVAIPMVLTGVLSIAAGLLNMLLTETKGRPLIDTVSEMNTFFGIR